MSDRKDPHQVHRTTVANLDKLGIERHGPLKAIRQKCVECQGGYSEGASRAIAECSSTNCALWPWRSGKNPWQAGSRPGAGQHLRDSADG